MSEENIKNITKPGRNFAPTFVDYHLLPDINFNGYCLMNNISIPKKIISIYNKYIIISLICYNIFLTNPSLRNLNTDFPLNICFGSVKLTKNVDPDKYKYSSYDIGFDSHLELLFIDESMKRNFIVFGADMSWSDNLYIYIFYFFTKFIYFTCIFIDYYSVINSYLIIHQALHLLPIHVINNKLKEIMY